MQQPSTITKTCRTCRVKLPIDNFHICKGQNKNYHCSTCKQCLLKAQAAFMEQNGIKAVKKSVRKQKLSQKQIDEIKKKASTSS